MNLKQYVQEALQTENHIAFVETDKPRLVEILKATIAAGNLLDVLKKDMFYGAISNPEKQVARAQRIAFNEDNLLQAAGFFADPESNTPTQLTNLNSRVAHAIIGLATESVELLEALLVSIETGADFDRVNILEELGDLNWYHAIAIDALEGDWEQVQATNLAKLVARNKGKKFNADAVINRDVDSERVLLEQNLAVAHSQ
jgi:NTP pyrophosphatase (non-canonical NTP hydrolase)